MNYEKLTKKELIELCKSAETTIKRSLDIANNKIDKYKDKNDYYRMGLMIGTLENYVEYKLHEHIAEDEKER